MHAFKPLIVILSLAVIGIGTAGGNEKQDYKALYRQGVEYNKQGKLDEAISYYTKALSLKPDSPELYFVRGRAFRQKEDHDRALSDFNKALTLNPGYAEVYNQRGVVYVGKGQNSLAEADFKKACSLGHQDACSNLKRLQGKK